MIIGSMVIFIGIQASAATYDFDYQANQSGQYITDGVEQGIPIIMTTAMHQVSILIVKTM